MDLRHGVIDFVADIDGGPVQVLEVNQFADSTGSGLFHWDADRAVLTEDLDCPIRVRESPVQVESLTMPQEWRELLTQ